MRLDNGQFQRAYAETTVSHSWDFLRLSEVATRSGLSKATAFIATLIAEGLVYRNAANGTYGLGALYLRIADIVLSGIDVRERARAAMLASPDRMIHWIW